MSESKSPHDVIEAMTLHVIESLVRVPPYIALFSKKQLWFGNGMFKDADDKDARNGLREFMGIRIPRDVTIESKNAFYGYPALQKPWSFLNNITNHAMRQRVLWKTIDGGDLSDIRVMLGMGYVTDDGTLDPKQTKGISCYVCFLADNEMRPIQNDHIATRVAKGEKWFGYQILRNQVTHPHILAEKKKAASTIIINQRKLLGQKEYLNLNPGIDRKEIKWPDYTW